MPPHSLEAGKFPLGTALKGKDYRSSESTWKDLDFYTKRQITRVSSMQKLRQNWVETNIAEEVEGTSLFTILHREKPLFISAAFSPSAILLSVYRAEVAQTWKFTDGSIDPYNATIELDCWSCWNSAGRCTESLCEFSVSSIVLVTPSTQQRANHSGFLGRSDFLWPVWIPTESAGC